MLLGGVAESERETPIPSWCPVTIAGGTFLRRPPDHDAVTVAHNVRVGHENEVLGIVSDNIGVMLESCDTDPIVTDGVVLAETVRSEDIVGVFTTVDVMVRSTEKDTVVDSVSVVLRFPPHLLFDHVTERDGVLVFVCVAASGVASRTTCMRAHTIQIIFFIIVQCFLPPVVDVVGGKWSSAKKRTTTRDSNSLALNPYLVELCLSAPSSRLSVKQSKLFSSKKKKDNYTQHADLTTLLTFRKGTF